MKFDPRLKVLILGVGLALAATNASADGWGYATNGDSSSQEGWGATVVGADNNPRGLDPFAIPDANGLGPYRVPVSHTPTGAMYNVPWEEPQGESMGSIDITGQYGTGTTDAAKFDEYRDMSDGIYISHFQFQADGKSNDLSYMNVTGGNVGRKDQYYQANVGVYNDWKIHAYYDETPQVYEQNARLIFNGGGTNALTLVPGLQFTGLNTGATYAGGATGQPQSVTNSQIAQNILANTAESTVEQDRKKGGLRIDKVFDNNWSVYGSYSLERRTGDMPYGQDGGFFPGAFNITTPTANASEGRPVQVLYPTDFMEHVGIFGTSWSDRQDAFNAAIHISLFNDENKQVTWQNPYDQPAINVNQHTMTFSTFPDNQEGDLKLDYKHAFDGLMHSVFNTTGYFAVQRNDDDLLPNTSTTGWSGATVAPSGINYTYWNSLYVNPVTNTPCAGPTNGCLPTLSQSTTDAHNNIGMYSANWSFRPMDQLALKAGWRWYDQINSNNYTAFNPACAANEATPAAQQTGLGCGTATAYGMQNEDGNLSAISNAAGTSQRIRSFDTSYKKVDTTLNADYQITNKDSGNLNYTYETYDYAMRERSQTNENQIKLTLTSKEVQDGTLRVSGEYDKKTGSAYNQYAYMETGCVQYFTNYASCYPIASNTTIAANPGGLDTNIAGVKYDLSDRNQYTLIGRFNYMILSNLDGMLTAKEQIQEYPMGPFGRQTRRDQTYNAELNWQLSTTTSFYLWDTLQMMNQEQASLNANTGSCSTAAYDADQCSWSFDPGSLNNFVGVSTNFFTENSSDHDNVVGIGFSHLFDDKMKFDASLQYTATQTTENYADWCTGAVTNPLGGGVVANGCTAGLGLTPAPGQVMLNQALFNGVPYPSSISLPETWDRITFKMGLLVPMSKSTSVSLNYAFDRATESDYHYNGLAADNDVIGTRYYLSPDPGIGFSDQTFMVTLHYKM